MGELQCQTYEKQLGKGICSIVRPANVYGSKTTLIQIMLWLYLLIRKAYDNDILEVWGDGSAIRDFIYCKRCCKRNDASSKK